MDHFQAIVSHQGEHGAQAILENWEKYAGLRLCSDLSLEQRWVRFLRATDETLAQAA